MKGLFYSTAILITMTTVSATQAASLYAGQAKAAAVCSQCHGIRSTSTDAPFPPLAGRDQNYLEMALKQYRNKSRISDIMNNIAGSLTDKDITNISAYYSRQKVK